MTMRIRVASTGAALVLAVGGLAACGSSQDVTVGAAAGAGAGGATAIERASVRTVAIDTAKLSLTVAATGLPGSSGPATVTADGAIDNTNGRAELNVDLSQATAGLPEVAGGVLGALGDGHLQVVTDGSNAYLKIGALASIFGATSNKSWVKLTGDGTANASKGSAVADGTDILKILGQAGDVTTVGTEAVRGVETTHYRGTLDVSAALGQLGADERAEVQDRLAQLGIDPKAINFPVDVWIGQDDLVRRVQVGLDGSQFEGANVPTGGLDATVTLELYDFGAPVDITVPSADQVFTVDPGSFPGISLPGLGGGQHG
ncbi:MAG TPA: LppX_LprAFG lipoprotein [Acidimicrobiales bacterium]|nr:LppX_LprAFG lipoprotein [Acidimicrobiales bacterium]